MRTQEGTQSGATNIGLGIQSGNVRGGERGAGAIPRYAERYPLVVERCWRKRTASTLRRTSARFEMLKATGVSTAGYGFGAQGISTT